MCLNEHFRATIKILGMRLKILIFLVTILCGNSLYSQQLTIDETLEYINGSLIKMYYETMKLSVDSDGYVYNKRYRFHPDDVSISTYTGNEPHVRINCGKADRNWQSLRPSCIECVKSDCVGNGTSLKAPSTDTFTIQTKNSRETVKVKNAITYLFSIIKEKYPNREDFDPFAPENFNKNAVEIKGTKDKDVIQLSESNGVYKIWVSLGGVKKHFILDSGASDVAVSENVESELIKNGVLKKEYYIEPALYRIADGSIVKCRRFILPNLEIGNYKVQNVSFSVGVSNTPLLLGKSLLNKFKTWKINNTNKTLELER